MKLHIKLHPNSSRDEIRKIPQSFDSNAVSRTKEKIEKFPDNNYEVWIKEKPIDGKANEELIKILKKYFKKDVKIVSGFTSRNKIVEVE
jgi:uncharacterized protein (TIGR00251 family)